LRIGELAVRTGVSTHAIRFYERKGVLPPAPRTASGYRAYPPEAVEQVDFVKKAQVLGLRLDDIADVLEISSGGRQPCEHVRQLVKDRLGEVETRLRELRQLRTTLRGTLRLLDHAPAPTAGCRCAVIEGAAAIQDTDPPQVPLLHAGAPRPREAGTPPRAWETEESTAINYKAETAPQANN